MRVIDLIWSPVDEFRRIDRNPPWLLYLSVFSIGTIALGKLMEPFVRKAAVLDLQAFLTADEINRALATDIPWILIGVALVPLFSLAKAAVLAAIAWAIGILSGFEMDYRRSLTVILAASLVFLIKGFVMLLILELRGIEWLAGPEDLAPPLGLDLFLRGSDPISRTLIASVNPFDFWYIVLLSIGFKQISRASLGLALRVGLPLWGISVICEARILAWTDQFRLLFLD